MKLREFLIASRMGRAKKSAYDLDAKISEDKDYIREIARTEYEYMSRRLKMLFGKAPCFTFPYIDIGEKKDDKPKLGEKQTEALLRLVSIFWYVVFLHFEGDPGNKKQLDKGIKIIYKTANKKFSNDDERQRSYLSYFNHSRKELIDLYEFFREHDDYYLSPQDIIYLPEYQFELIKRGEQLLEVKINMQKSIDLFENSINQEAEKEFWGICDGYTESLKEAYESEISESEKDLLECLCDSVVGRNIFDNKRLHDEFSVLEEEDGKSISEKIQAIYENDGLLTLNRYIQAQSKDEFFKRFDEVLASLAYTESDRAYNKYAKLHRLLGNLEKYDVSDEDLITYEKHVTHLIEMLEKYSKVETHVFGDVINSDKEYHDFLNRINFKK